MKSEDTSETRQLLFELREEHRDLDLAIERMVLIHARINCIYGV